MSEIPQKYTWSRQLNCHPSCSCMHYAFYHTLPLFIQAVGHLGEITFSLHLWSCTLLGLVLPFLPEGMPSFPAAPLPSSRRAQPPCVGALLLFWKTFLQGNEFWAECFPFSQCFRDVIQLSHQGFQQESAVSPVFVPLCIMCLLLRITWHVLSDLITMCIDLIFFMFLVLKFVELV